MLKDHYADKMFLLQKMGKTLTFSKVDPQSPTNRATQASSWLQPEQPTICGPPCILQPLFVESKAPRDAMTSTGWVKPWHSQKNQQNQEKKWKQSKVSTTMQPSHNLQTKMCPVFHPRLALLQLNCLPGHSLLYKTRSWLIFTWSHTHAFLQRVHHNTRPSTAKGAPRTRLRQAFQSKRASPHNLSCKTHTHTLFVTNSVEHHVQLLKIKYYLYTLYTKYMSETSDDYLSKHLVSVET